jgi:hypothetical protein
LLLELGVCVGVTDSLIAFVFLLFVFFHFMSFFIKASFPIAFVAFINPLTVVG